MSRPIDNQIICCISEGRADVENFTEIKRDIIAKIRNAASYGVTHFQIREKKLTSRLLFELTAEAASIAAGSGVKVLVNGRADIALAANADGVHLPADGVPARELRSRVPGGFIIGVSTHSVDEVLQARDANADFAVFGPVFPSPGKGGGVGLDELEKVCAEVSPFPILALGGVDAGNFRDALERGAAGFAAIRYLNECLRAETRP